MRNGFITLNWYIKDGLVPGYSYNICMWGCDSYGHGMRLWFRVDETREIHTVNHDFYFKDWIGDGKCVFYYKDVEKEHKRI